MTDVLIRREKFGHTYQGEHHVKTQTHERRWPCEDGDRAFYSIYKPWNANDCWQTAEISRGKKDLPPWISEGAWPD